MKMRVFLVRFSHFGTTHTNGVYGNHANEVNANSVCRPSAISSWKLGTVEAKRKITSLGWPTHHTPRELGYNLYSTVDPTFPVSSVSTPATGDSLTVSNMMMKTEQVSATLDGFIPSYKMLISREYCNGGLCTVGLTCVQRRKVPSSKPFKDEKKFKSFSIHCTSISKRSLFLGRFAGLALLSFCYE